MSRLPVALRLGATVSAAALALLLSGGVADGAGASATIAGFAFHPASITIRTGQSVTWTDGSDPAQHTVTSDTGAFGSAALSTGQTFTVTFRTAGTFAYHCSIHPNMTGSVTVLPAGPTPAPTARPTPRPTPRATPRPTPRATATPRPSARATANPTPLPTNSPSVSASPAAASAAATPGPVQSASPSGAVAAASGIPSDEPSVINSTPVGSASPPSGDSGLPLIAGAIAAVLLVAALGVLAARGRAPRPR
jgi:plastocyanin